MRSLKIVIIFSFIWLSPADCTQCPTIRPCPSFKLLGDTSRQDVVQSLISETILNLWNLNKLAPSKRVDALENAMFNMLGSGSCELQNTTMGSTYLYWVLATQMNRNPGLCSYAALANATIADCCESTKKALQRVPATFSIAARLLAAGAMENSGCGNSTYTPPLDWCNNGGRINVDALIHKIHDKYPKDFLRALKRVCKSKTFQEQISCIITSAHTLPEFRLLTSELSDELKLSFFHLFLIPVVPPLCCPDFNKQLDYLLSLIDAEAQRATDVITSKLPC